MSLREVLEAELRRFQVDLTPEQKSKLAGYCSELVRWNAKINLTGLQGEELVRRLVVIPVWIGNHLKMSGVAADIGSGNGSPAIPLHLVSDLTTTHLIEARAKRAAFLRHVVNFLKINGVVVHRSRLEDIKPELKAVDWITLQGVALTLELLDGLKRIARSTTRVVWITSDPSPPITPQQRLQVPSTNTEALTFQLDLP